MPTMRSTPQGGLPSPDIKVTNMDSSMHDLSDAPSSNIQDSDDEASVQDTVGDSNHGYSGMHQSIHCTMDSSLHTFSSEESGEDKESASQTTNELPATELEMSVSKPKERTSITSLQQSDKDTESILQSEESDEDADIVPPSTHDITMTDTSEGDDSEESDDDEPSVDVKPVRKVVVQMMKETKFQPNAKNHTFYNHNGTLISPIHPEYTDQGTDLRGWFEYVSCTFPLSITK